MKSRRPISGPEITGDGESWGSGGGHMDLMRMLLGGGGEVDNSAVLALLGGGSSTASSDAPVPRGIADGFAMLGLDPHGNPIDSSLSVTKETYRAHTPEFMDILADTGAWTDQTLPYETWSAQGNLNRYNDVPNTTMHDGKVRMFSWAEDPSTGQLRLDPNATAWQRDADTNTIVPDADGPQGHSMTWWEQQVASEVNAVGVDGQPKDFQYSMGFEDLVTGEMTRPDWAEGLDLSTSATPEAEQLVLPGFEDILGLPATEEQMVLPGFEDIMSTAANDAPVAADTALVDTALADTAVLDTAIDGATPTVEAGETTTAGTPRMSYGSVGLLGGATDAVITLGSDLYRLSQGEDLSATDIALDVGGAGIRGASTSVATEGLARALGGTVGADIGAGGIISALTAGAMSTWNNADAYGNGDVSAADATANVVVDTGIGLSAGLAGAAAGAAIGSIIPGAGTVVGGVVGFLAGTVVSMLASTAVTEAAQQSGFTDWAKDGLGNLLSGAEEPLSAVWDNVASGQDAISDGLSDAWSWLTGASSSEQTGEPAAESSEDLGPEHVSDALAGDDAPDMCTLVDGSEALNATELVGDANALDNASYTSLWDAVGPSEIAEVAGGMDSGELAEAAATPEAKDIAEDLPEGTEKKVKEATKE